MRRIRISFYSAPLSWVGVRASYAQQLDCGRPPHSVRRNRCDAGVAMTGQGAGGTLLVGTVGGAETDIFTNNSLGGNVINPGLLAVSTDVSSKSNIAFNSSSNVFGALGLTQPGGPFFLNLSAGNTGTVVNFDGNVFATTLNVTGMGTVNFNSGSTNVMATNFGADVRSRWPRIRP